MNQWQRWLQTVLLGTYALSCWNAPAQPAADSHPDGNRLTYLDEADPFYVHLNFPKLTTPQWIGEAGVEAVVILAIDDLRDTPKYETVLRPLLERLKQIDGRAPVSIFCNTNNPANPQFQAWLKEGLSLEVHTLTHPCPCLAKNDFGSAAKNYHDCVDLLNTVPGNKAVAFRMPCCDSMNSPSPRFYAEIFNQASAGGQYLTIDSSVMNLTTPNDKSLPRDLVLDADGREKFRKYLPTTTNQVTKVAMDSFVTTIEDYPYPYVIGKLCWEFPPMVPSDWEANNAHRPTNAVTVADWKAALDATVIKQGVFTFIFHPHGWIRPDQMVEFIDYAVKKHGKKVKFLTFREAQERLDKNLLAGQPLRAANGQDNGARLLDVNNDGFLDVVIGNERVQKTRLWDPKQNVWIETGFPTEVAGAQFGVVRPNQQAMVLKTGPPGNGGWQFENGKWLEDKSLLNGLALDGEPVLTTRDKIDRGVRLRDVDNDGRCELIVGNPAQNAVFGWSPAEERWKKLDYELPHGTAIVDAQGRDNGLRFVDVNEDGFADVLFSNEQGYSLHQFVPKANPRLSWEVGWNDEVVAGKRDGSSAIPMIVRPGERASRPSSPPVPAVGEKPALLHSNNGVWFHSHQMWIQNEDTAALPSVVDRRSFKQLLTADQPPPKSPEESLASIQVRSGFKVELVASEPLVLDPIAFEWGADGKLWVVEMGDYPRGLDGNGKPGGIVRFLEDTDGDGRYDKSTVFLEGVNFPTGLMPWGKGVIVSTAPEIFYAEDTDGDGKADVRRTLFTGFSEGNQQHRINGFDYGLDNWLYAANGDSGGVIKRAGEMASGQKAVNMRGHDFRCQPDEGLFEGVAGQTQYGRHRDDWGNWFGNNNPTWLWHFHLPENYLARNPHLAVKTAKQVLANYQDSTRCFPSSRTQQRFNDPSQANHATSANSPTPYRDELFGPNFATSVFISEPVHNLIHREVLEPDGVTFKSLRAPDEKETEFLRSSDNWFRPTMLKTGPDGALYIADMYRLVIEHPEWIPPAIQQRLDLRAGADKGRIYRVYPEGAQLRKVLRLDKLDTAGLVAALDSPNGWQRDTAERLLAHAKDKSAADLLRRLAANSRQPKARLQALHTLNVLGVLTPEAAVAALKDSHPAVRENAVQLCEPFLRGTSTRMTAQQSSEVLRLVDDPEPRVRQQLAFSLGEWDDPRAAQALIHLASDARLQVAVMSSAPRHIGPMLAALFTGNNISNTRASLVAQLIGLAVALGDQPAFAKALGQIATPTEGKYAPWQFAAMAGLLDALDRQKISLKKFQDEGKADFKALRLEDLFAAARALSVDPQALEPARLDAIRLLGRGSADRDKDIDQLGELLRPEISSALQEASLAGLQRSSAPRVAEVVLAGWKGYGPALRTEVLNLLFSRPEWLKALLAVIESEKISTAGIGTVHQQKLVTHSDSSIRQRAVKLFSATRADRQAVLKEYRGVEKLIGEPAKGAALFRQNCSTCHLFKGEGHEIGVDLNTMAGKPIQVLLVAILDPNQAVEARYVNYTAQTKGDREISGVITAETATSITLRSPGGAEEVLLRSDLKELTSSGLSLMPEGFEKGLAPQDLADLISYILAR